MGVRCIPPENFEFGRFDFLYSGAFWGWPLPITFYSFRFIAYILTCRAWRSLHCIFRPTLWPFHQHQHHHYLTHCCYSDIEQQKKSDTIGLERIFLGRWKSVLIDSRMLTSLYWLQRGRRPWLGGGLYFKWAINSLAKIIDVQTH